MTDLEQSDPKLAKLLGKKLRLLGKHPWAGESAEVVGFDDRIGLRVKLLRQDAMYGHECFVTNPKEMRWEKKGLDW